MIPLVWKFLLGRLALVLAFLGLKARWVSEGRKQQVQVDTVRTLRVVHKAVEVENEVEALDRDTLKRRAAKWVRGSDK